MIGSRWPRRSPPSPCLNHVRASMPAPPPAEPAPPATPADRLQSLDVTALTYRHPDTGRGIEDVSFQLARGEFVVVTGRAGAGKTTLLRALLGLLPADVGTIRWNGVPVP